MEQPPFFSEQKEHLTPEETAKSDAQLEALEPSGDPRADAIRFDELTNQGRLAAGFQSDTVSLRMMVVLRSQVREHLESSGLNDRQRDVFNRQLHVLDRILSHYGVAAQTFREFDEREGAEQGL